LKFAVQDPHVKGKLPLYDISRSRYKNKVFNVNSVLFVLRCKLITRNGRSQKVQISFGRTGDAIELIHWETATDRYLTGI